MNEICRLCLSVTSEIIHNLRENSELVQKITSCLQVEILHEDCLPNQICLNCNEKIIQMHSFMKMVLENQHKLHNQMKFGKNCLDNFYISLKQLKDENQGNMLEIKKEKPAEMIENINNKIEREIPIKHKVDKENVEENDDYSSDDNITLLSLRETNQTCYKISEIQNQNKKQKRTHQMKTVSESMDTKDCILINSLNISTKIFEFKCLTCFKIFDTRQTLTKHYKEAHKPTTPMKCDVRNFSEVKESGEIKYKCGVCEKMFMSTKLVKHHIQYKHEDSRPYICNLCGRTFKTIAEIILHLRAHNSVKLFCSYNCGFSSAYIAGLRTHERKHRNEYKFKCDTCGKGFEVKTWYEEHQNIHTGAKPFVCSECGLAYPFRRYLVRHQTMTHPVTAPPSEKTRYVCVQCSQPCDTKVALKTHMFTEHGIKSGFLCDICGKSFKRSSHLHNHKRYHLGIKNHTCSTCNKSFTTRNALKRHEWTHIGYRKYGCSKCGKRYTHRAALDKHYARLHSVPVEKCPE